MKDKIKEHLDDLVSEIRGCSDSSLIFCDLVKNFHGGTYSVLLSFSFSKDMCFGRRSVSLLEDIGYYGGAKMDEKKHALVSHQVWLRLQSILRGIGKVGDGENDGKLNDVFYFTGDLYLPRADYTIEKKLFFCDLLDGERANDFYHLNDDFFKKVFGFKAPDLEFLSIG